MIWRFSEEEVWKIYGYLVMAFGDKIAATALECAKKKIADLGEEIDKDAAARIRSDLYVDDGVSGGSLEEVERFIGTKDESGKYVGTLQQIFSKGNFTIKEFNWSGRDMEETESVLGSSVLGYKWHSKSDIMAVKLKINLSKKKRKIAKHPDLTKEDLDKLKAIKFTKRKLLGVRAGIFDPLGIAAPYTIKLSIGMKQIFENEESLGWDDPIPSHLVNWWIYMMTEAIRTQELRFPRCTKPKNAIEGPILVGFCDGSLSAYAANIYLRWKMSEADEDGNFYSV